MDNYDDWMTGVAAQAVKDRDDVCQMVQEWYQLKVELEKWNETESVPYFVWEEIFEEITDDILTIENAIMIKMGEINHG